MKAMGNLFKATFLKVFYEDLEIASRVIKEFSSALLDWLQEHGKTLGLAIKSVGSVMVNPAMGYMFSVVGETLEEMSDHLEAVRNMMRDEETREEIRMLNSDMLESMAILSGGRWSVPNRNTNNSGSKRSPGSRSQGGRKKL
jgi:hypothetical protein